MSVAKIFPLEIIAERLAALRATGKTIVQCHGCFDLMHIGHIKHLQAAKRMGDTLVVTVTADEYVAKGEGRPVFGEFLRAEALAALECVDFVAINHRPTAVEAIRLVRPHYYVKGQVCVSCPIDPSSTGNDYFRPAWRPVGSDTRAVVLRRHVPVPHGTGCR